jgi:PAS domain S-box-containing protein
MNLNQDASIDGQIDERRPLYSSRIMMTYLEFIKKYYPDVEIDSLLTYAGMTRYEVEDPGHWFNQNQTDRFNEFLVAKTGVPDIAREAGRFTVSSENMGAARQYVLGLITIPTIYAMMGKIANTMTRGSIFKAKKISASKAEILSIPEPGVKEKPYQCQNRIGTLESLAKLFTTTFAKVEHPSCFHKTGDCCQYIVTWPTTESLSWRRILKYSLLFSLLLLIIAYFSVPVPITNILVIGCLLINIMIWLNAERIEKKELKHTIDDQGNAAKALLGEINTRHNNAQLIQEIGQAISGFLDIDKISRVVLKNIHKHTNYDVGSILLANKKKTRLRRNAEFLSENNKTTILKYAEFELKHTDAEGVLTECFKNQKPIVVNDVTKIDKDLAKKYSAHINLLDIKSFICIPITYKEESLGILVVGNRHPKNQLPQSDISLLMGVAAHIATSIINAQSFSMIKKSEERYRLLADNVTDVIWVLDIHSLKFTYVSPSVRNMQGFSPQEIREKSLQEILLPNSFKKAAEVITEELAVAKPIIETDPLRSRVLELEEYCKDGSTIWIEVTANFLRNDSGEVVNILGVARDISDRKIADQEREKLLEQLQRAEKMEAIGTLAGVVAHDLNNILSSIISYPELLLMNLDPDNPIRKPIEAIYKSGQKAAAIVEDLLTLARRGVSISEVVNLNTIITDYLEGPEFEKLSTFHLLLDVQKDLSPELINIKGSSVHLSKTIMNLVSNAAEAMPDGGTLSISTENRYVDQPVRGYEDIQEGDYTALVVSDTGIGISPDEIKQIFEPFYTKKVMGRSGTGLGMSVVWGTVKDHKGYIDIESVPGKGTRFTLFFPVTHEELSKSKADFSIGDYSGNGESILVVDDIKEQRMIASSILSRLRYSVQTVSCGEAAVEYLKNNSVDLVILDMIMEPGMDGLDTYKKILKLYPDQKAVIASGYSETDRVKEAQQLGAGEYIKKPYTIKKISVAIKLELGRNKAVQ